MKKLTTERARRESLANAKRVSNAARRVVEIFERTPKTIHYGFPAALYPAMRLLKSVLDPSRPRRPRSKRKAKR